MEIQVLVKIYLCYLHPRLPSWSWHGSWQKKCSPHSSETTRFPFKSWLWNWEGLGLSPWTICPLGDSVDPSEINMSCFWAKNLQAPNRKGCSRWCLEGSWMGTSSALVLGMRLNGFMFYILVESVGEGSSVVFGDGYDLHSKWTSIFLIV